MPRPINYLDPEEGTDFLPPDDETFTGSSYQEPKKQLDSAPLQSAIERRSTVMAQRPAEPKPKWWQRLAAGAAGGAAGYVNAGGRTRPIDVGPLTQEILAPGHRRKLSDWMGQVETAEADVQGEQQRRAAEMQDLQMQEARAGAQERRAASAAAREAAEAQRRRQERADITAEGVEEIKARPAPVTVPTFERTHTVGGLPGQQINVGMPEEDYVATFEVGGKKYGKRSAENIARGQQRVAQENWLTITQEMAAAMNQPSLAELKVPPNEFAEFVKMAQGTTPTGKPLHIVKEDNEITGDVTVTGFDPLTMKQVAQVVLPKIAQKRPPAVPASIQIGNLVPDDAVTQEAQKALVTGKTPASGRNPVFQARVIKRMSELVREQGLDPTSLPAMQAGYQANAASLADITKRKNQLETFEQTARGNLDNFIAQAKKVSDLGVPILNKPWRTIQSRVMGDPQLAAFDAARTVAFTEASRVLSGSMGGVLSDSARREAEHMIRGDYTLEQMISAVDLIKRDMDQRKNAFATQLAEINAAMRASGGSSRGSDLTPVGGSPSGKVAVISPEGTPGFIDADKWAAAEKRGFKKQ